MRIPVPKRILSMIVYLCLLDSSAEILSQTFPILASTIRDMNNHTLIAHYGITPTETSISFLNSFITSAETFGTLLSLILILPIADTRGKKLLIVYMRFGLTMVSAICQLSSAFLQATEFYILSRFFDGLHHPLRSFLTFMYVTECAPDKNRGFACTALIILNGMVRMVMLPIASPSFLGKSDTWFVFPLAALISGFLNLILTSRLTESPKWLVCQNRMEEAKKSVEYYHGEDCFANGVLLNFIREKNLTEESHISLKEIWENDTMREGLKVLFSYLLFMLFDSANVQAVYSVLLHQSAGYTVQEALNINLIMTMVFFPTQFFSTFLLDYLGRRPVMLIAGILTYSMSWLILITQWIIYLFGSSLLTKILYLVMEVFSNASLNTGATALRILFITELFPPSAKTAVSQAMLFTNLAINSSLMSSFPILYSFFPPAFFTPFVFTQLVCGTFLYRHMPETRGRAVCDIIESMDEDVASRTFSFIGESTPLMKSRAGTLTMKRNSILNTSRSRTSTYDQKYILNKNIY
ncbi:unnamed protein product [Caenorhabditis brenneri]